MSRLPIIGITECFKQYGPHAYHFSRASVILDGADGTPITVTPFNIEPIHNSGPAIVRHRSARDSARPAWHVHLRENTIACR